MKNPNDIYVIENMPDDLGGNNYRRDYISIVYYDNDKNVGITKPNTPYWRYVVGENYFEVPVFKHQQKIYDTSEEGELWKSSLNKKDNENNPAVYKEYIIYSLSMEYDTDENQTDLDSIAIIPNVVGISDLIHFVESKLNYDDELKLYKVGQNDKSFYHPYKTFTPLDPSYGQGDSIVKEGFTTSSTEYTTNQLNNNYIDFNDKYATFYNLPLKISEIENDYTFNENIALDHILLGYKKEGFWNDDNISINNPLSSDHEKIFKMIDGAWSEIESPLLYSFGSWIPEKATEGQYFQLTEDIENGKGIYKYSGGSWTLVNLDDSIKEAAIDNTRRVRFGNTLPNDVNAGDFFELINNNIVNSTSQSFDDGLYKYELNGAELEWILQTYTEGTELPSSYSEGDYFKSLGGSLAIGWYEANSDMSGDPSIYDWTKIDVPYGNAFNGGSDRNYDDEPRWSSTPYDGEFFKSDGTSDASKGWYMYIYDQESFINGYWRKLPIHWGTKLPPTSDLDEETYFACNGEESEIEGPAKGLYKFNVNEWKRFPYTSDTSFPSNAEDKDHFYLEEETDGYSTGIYRFDKGLWYVAKTVNEIEGESFEKVGFDFPFEADSGENEYISDLIEDTDLYFFDELYNIKDTDNSLYGMSTFKGYEAYVGYSGLLAIESLKGKSGTDYSEYSSPETDDYYLLDNEDTTYTLQQYDGTVWNNVATVDQYDFFVDEDMDNIYQYDSGWAEVNANFSDDIYIFVTNENKIYSFTETTPLITEVYSSWTDYLLLIHNGETTPTYTL